LGRFGWFLVLVLTIEIGISKNRPLNILREVMIPVKLNTTSA